MTEKDDVDCSTSIETANTEDDDAKTAQEVIVKDSNVTSANQPASKYDSAISKELTESVKGAISPKESTNGQVDENKEGTEDQKARISWTLEGEQFKVTWSLLEGVATSKDFIALCRVGEC